MAKTSQIVAGLDIGSTHVVTTIMEIMDGKPVVTGVASVPSGGGLRAGQIVSIDHAIEAIRQSVEEASRMADCEVATVRLGVGGPGAMGFNSDGTVAVRGGRVTEADVARVLETAGAVRLPADKQILHVLPQEFIIDGQDGIRSPVGMTGVRLEARVHVITGSRSGLVNAIECVNRAGLTVERVGYTGLAASASVLSDEERELGVVLVDIGGGTTDVAVWYDNALVHSVTIEGGGEDLTRQIARGLRTPKDAAELVKQDFGCALASMVREGETMEVPGVGGRAPQERQRHLLCEILEPGLEDIFQRVGQEIDVANCREHLAAGVVLTGGTSLLDSIADLGEEVLAGLPVRVGRPGGFGGLDDIVADPRYAVSVGLCLDTFAEGVHPVAAASQPKAGSGILKALGDKIKVWF